MIDITLDNRYLIINKWEWFDNPSEDSLFNDIKRISFDINTYIGKISQQKERILVLNEMIKMIIGYLQNGSYNYEHHLILDNVKHFIKINNKSIVNFNLEVQLLINDNYFSFKINNK